MFGFRKQASIAHSVQPDWGGRRRAEYFKQLCLSPHSETVPIRLEFVQGLRETSVELQQKNPHFLLAHSRRKPRSYKVTNSIKLKLFPLSSITTV